MRLYFEDLHLKSWLKAITIASVAVFALALVPTQVYSAPDTETLRPDSSGDYSEWDINDSTDYGATSDQSDTTYLYTTIEDETCLMNLTDHSTGSGTINSVTVYNRVQVSGGSGQPERGSTYIKTNGSYYQGTETRYPDAPEWEDISTVYTTNPDTGQSWTWDEVDALQAGCITVTHTTSEEMRCSEVWIVVDYTIVSPPTVVTDNATDVEETTATLKGEITGTGGENCDLRGFEWDIDSGTPYSNNWTRSGSFGTGNFPHGLTSLTEGELYYFRAMAHNSAGWGYGSELTFLTKPDGPTGLQDTGRTNSSITLEWTKGTGAQKTMIRYRTDQYPTDTSDGTQAYFDTDNSTTVPTLSAGQIYYFRAWSYATEGGKEQYSDLTSDDTAYTSPGDPSNLTSSNPTANSIDLEWTKGTGGDKTMVRRKEGSYPTSETDGVQAYFGMDNMTTDSGLNLGTTYYYRAWAYDSDSGYYSANFTEDFATTYQRVAANFNATPTSGISPLTVQFRDTSTGDIASWSWDFGDGGSSTQQNPSHTYTSAGVYTVKLTVTGPGGINTKTDYIRVREPVTGRGPRPASFSCRHLNISPTQTYPNQPVTISLSVVNTGGTRGSYNVALNINGKIEQSQKVSVNPGSHRRVSFTTTKSTPGTYDVYVGGMHGWLYVIEIIVVSPPAPAVSPPASTVNLPAPPISVPATTLGLDTSGIIAIAVISIIVIVGIVVAIRLTRQV